MRPISLMRLRSCEPYFYLSVGIKMINIKLLGEKFWRRERVGFVILTSCILIIFCITLFLFIEQRKAREHHIQAQGISVSKLFSNIPYEQIERSSKHGSGILQVMRYSIDQE